MFFGDLFKNTSATVQIQIRPEGRNAFYKWIHDSVASGKPYNQMATELIAAQGNNSFDQSNGPDQLPHPRRSYRRTSGRTSSIRRPPTSPTFSSGSPTSTVCSATTVAAISTP